MRKVEKLLNRLTTVLVFIAVFACIVIGAKTMLGREASVFGYRFYHILTGSMEPTIPTGANVIVKETDPMTLQVGDVITFRSEQLGGAANTHRIIAVEQDGEGRLCYVTKGDANAAQDSERVYPEAIKGKVVSHLNLTGFSMFFKFLQTKAGFVTVILLPLMFLSWLFLKDFRKQVKALALETARAQLEAEEEAEKENAAEAPNAGAAADGEEAEKQD